MKTELASFYPVICTRDVAAARDFYTRHLGFTTTFEADWYVSLRRPDAPHYELALLDSCHPTLPEGHRNPTQGGLLLNFEVTDVDAEHRRLPRPEPGPVPDGRPRDRPGHRGEHGRGPDADRSDGSERSDCSQGSSGPREELSTPSKRREPEVFRPGGSYSVTVY